MRCEGCQAPNSTHITDLGVQCAIQQHVLALHVGMDHLSTASWGVGLLAVSDSVGQHSRMLAR